jgi:hypothetical protein
MLRVSFDTTQRDQIAGFVRALNTLQNIDSARRGGNRPAASTGAVNGTSNDEFAGRDQISGR